MAISLPEFVFHPDEPQLPIDSAAWPHLQPVFAAPPKTEQQHTRDHLQVVQSTGTVACYASVEDCDIHDDLALVRVSRLLRY